MLLQFVVENYRSIKDRVVLSMLAPEGTPLDTRFTRRVGEWNVLRCAAIYGANAAGKSNVVMALTALSMLVLRGTVPGSGTPVVPFRLDPEWSNRPSRFEVELLLDGVHHAYGIILTAGTIEREWFYRIEGESEVLLFERNAPADRDTTEHVFTFGESVSSDDERRQFLRFVGKGTRPNQPFIAECPQRNVNEFEGLSRWFQENLSIVFPGSPYMPLVSALENEQMRGFVENCLRSWGTGVESLDLHRQPLDGMERLEIVQNSDLAKHLDERRALARTTRNGEPRLTYKDDDGMWQKRIRFHHAASHEPFSWTDESDGTQRLMHLLPILWNSKQRTSASPVFVIDELERSLHAVLTRRFVEEFLDLGEAHPDAGGQLVFTTHDTNLLNGRLLSAASIWFVEKDRTGATHLYSLAEYPPEQVERLTDHLEDGYLQGRFGAIPFMATREQLGWAKTDTTS